MLKKVLRAVTLVILTQASFSAEKGKQEVTALQKEELKSEAQLPSADTLDAPMSTLTLSKVPAKEQIFPFTFLSTHYPHLVAEADKGFRSFGSQEKPWLSMAIGGKDQFLTGAKESFGLVVIDPMILQGLLGIPRSKQPIYCSRRLELIEPILKELPDIGFFQTIKTRKLNPKLTAFEDIVLAAEFVYELLNQRILLNQGSENKTVVLDLGRTGGPVQLAYERLLEITHCQNQTVVHVSFSGHPDMDVARTASFYAQNPDVVRTRNMVTEGNLAHFFQYLDSKKLLDYKKIHILDMINKGPGMNSFLKVLKCYFESRGHAFPEIEFLCLMPFGNLEALNTSQTIMKYEPKAPGRGVLHFPAETKSNFTAFDLPTTAIPIDQLTIAQVLDNDFFQDLGSFGIEYPPQKWTPEFDEAREKGGIYSKEITAFINTNSVNYIKHHMKSHREQSAKQVR